MSVYVRVCMCVEARRGQGSSRQHCAREGGGSLRQSMGQNCGPSRAQGQGEGGKAGIQLERGAGKGHMCV